MNQGCRYVHQRTKWCKNFKRKFFLKQGVHNSHLITYQCVQFFCTLYGRKMLRALSWIDEKRINMKKLFFQKKNILKWYKLMSNTIKWYHLKSYAIIQDHVISWILIRNHRFNRSESTANDNKWITKKKIHFFNVFLEVLINFLSF